jgi:hypothetical protein
MKRVFALLAVAIIIALLVVTLRRHSQQTVNLNSTSANSEAVALPAPSKATSKNPVRTNKSTMVATAAPRSIPVSLQSEKSATPFLLGSASAPPSISADVVLNNLRNVVNLYGAMFGANPVGNNPEITDALNGGNPKQARLINEESGLRVNGRGELVDPWGTPFFFHQLSAHEMEIRSAGADMKMWTRDDLVTK